MSAIEIVEQAAALLRRAPARAVAAYLAGAVPFTIAALFFLNEVLHSPFAGERLAEMSLGIAALYIWKNIWQAVFAAELYLTLSPAPRRRIDWPRLAAIQSALPPLGLIASVPAPWLISFFRNAALFAALGAPDPIRRARRQASFKPKQNWGVLGIVFLGGLLLFANIVVTIGILPTLLRSFLGIEGDLARAGQRIINPATLAASLALAWMAVDPLLDAVNVLRCFQGESVATGEDLLAALRRAAAALAIAAAMAWAVPPARAQVNAQELDRSIDQVIHTREFTWRAPRPDGPEPQGKLAKWIRGAERMMARLRDWIGDLIRRWFDRSQPAGAEGKDSPVTRRTLELLIGGVVALIVAAAVFFFLRRRAPVVAAEGAGVAAAPVDLADESITADRLPESSWLRLAEEYSEKGEYRLALRALYLAALNHLSSRGVVSIRRWKSGLDYRREVRRRARAAEIAPEFSSLSGIFERGWYGTRAVNREMFEAAAAGLAGIRMHAAE